MFMQELANCAGAKARFFLPQFHRPEGRCSHKTLIFGARDDFFRKLFSR
jgi:hypothetical protein